MPEIGAALATVGWADAHLEALRGVLAPAELVHCHRRDARTIATALARVDVAILPGDLDRRHLEAPRLRWVHCDHAGLEGSARPEVFARGLQVTGSAGRSAPALAEHALFFMLSLAYRAPALHEAQRRRRWSAPGRGAQRVLHGATLGILGLGHTGAALARRARALGMRVLAYRRQDLPPPEGVERVYSAARGESPHALLAESDHVVLALRLSDATAGIVGARELETMKTSAFLVNVARGRLVDERALAHALRDGSIAGAGLDAFAVEPLPRSSPLWRAPNTLITPHSTPPLPDRTERSLEILRENVARYRSGRPLRNALTPDDVYTGPPARRGSRSRLRRAFRGARRP